MSSQAEGAFVVKNYNSPVDEDISTILELRCRSLQQILLAEEVLERLLANGSGCPHSLTEGFCNDPAPLESANLYLV
jgi:hypothetical protein